MKAFPIVIDRATQIANDTNFAVQENGMDLRDYFAAKVLPVLSKLDVDAFPNLDYVDIAELAYKYADAMMEVRKNDCK